MPSNADFREALTCLFEETRMARVAWKTIDFVVMMPQLNLPPNSRQEPGAKVNDRTAKYIGKDNPLNCQPYFAAYTHDTNVWQPGWVPTQEDMFAEDWYSVDDMTSTEADMKSTEAEVTVNGRKIFIDTPISYEDLMVLAGYAPERILSATYHRAKDNRDGILSPGQSVHAIDGTQFSVADTSNA